MVEQSHGHECSVESSAPQRRSKTRKLTTFIKTEEHDPPLAWAWRWFDPLSHELDPRSIIAHERNKIVDSDSHHVSPADMVFAGSIAERDKFAKQAFSVGQARKTNRLMPSASHERRSRSY